jgi:hypothetical protein
MLYAAVDSAISFKLHAQAKSNTVPVFAGQRPLRASWHSYGHRGGPLLGHLQIFDLVNSSFVETLGAVQVQYGRNVDFPDALLDHDFLFAFQRLFIFSAAQLALNLHMRSFLSVAAKSASGLYTTPRCHSVRDAHSPVSLFFHDRLVATERTVKTLLFLL